MSKKNNTQTLQFIILALLIVIWIGSTHFVISKKTENIANDVMAKFLAVEYNKVWGKANYDKITQITKEQTIAGLKQYNAQWWAQPQAQAAPTPLVGWEIATDKVKKVQENAYILWNPDAEITWVEYSDLECPFCKRLHEAGTIEEVMKAYDGKVNFIFKQFPLDFHKQAPMEAEAALCAGEIAWDKKYYEFIWKVFENSEARWNSYTMESISKLWSTIWIDETKLLTCIKLGKNKARAQAEMAEWKTFWITGTPWNVLINNKTGKWDKLPGAYPTSAFKEKIDALLK